MYRKEVNAHSPLRILEKSIHGGLGPGNLGVVMARAGVGKTAFLVQMGLDDAMRQRAVLHVALGQDLEHVQSWYDALFDDLAELHGLDERETVRSLVAQHRVIQAFPDRGLAPERLEHILKLYSEHLKFEPRAILVDGYDWEGTVVRRAAELGALKTLAKRLNAELWMGAQTHREVTTDHPTRLTPPCAQYDELIDLALFLEPQNNSVAVRILKDHDNAALEDVPLLLHPDTMRLARENESQRPLKLPARAFTLLSGGSNGAENAFGELAEKWGLTEMNFSFKGRETARTRGVVELDEAALRRGQVSSTYIESHLHRTFPKTEMFQRILQTIWHQVNTAGEVFVVGELQSDQTVKGGTGWAAELARHFNKPLYVYDQVQQSWFLWQGAEWTSVERPKIQHTRFAGTGTRFLTDEGRNAIERLFEDSFGAA